MAIFMDNTFGKLKLQMPRLSDELQFNTEYGVQSTEYNEG